MDLATIIGLVLGIALILGSISIGGSLLPFVNIPSMMIVLGGSFAALLINSPMSQVIGLFSVLKNCFVAKLPETNAVIQQFTDLARSARRDGLLSLENEMETINDPFLKRGLEMVIGGNSRDELTSVLETEIICIEQRHENGRKILEAIAAAAPAFGMIGTLIGLVQMLRTLEDPSQIGVGMATALLTTLYGAVIANLFCIPLAGKLETRSKDEALVRELMMSGLSSLVDGLAPRVVQERMAAFVSESKRPVTPTQAA
ncbi:MotA/TolQ/ExbB proton channel family protein [Thalassoglobus sp. JC818]|uniref:motility protein A n=1 Tax=Thalassoglobus sp. JC818 TaxID=3232136 RepID=UPI00345A0089